MMMTAFCFLGFFKQMAENTKEEETKQKKKTQHQKKNKTKQNKQTEISLVLYLSTHT